MSKVELTAPYLHNGAYAALEAALRHQLDPAKGLENYESSQLEPEFRAAVHQDKKIIKDVKKTMSPELKLPQAQLNEIEISDLLAFLKSLTARQLVILLILILLILILLIQFQKPFPVV